MKRIYILLLFLFIFGCGTHHFKQPQYTTWKDEDLIREWSQLSYDKPITTDIALSLLFGTPGAHATSDYKKWREEVSLELQKRGYVYRDKQWIKIE